MTANLKSEDTILKSYKTLVKIIESTYQVDRALFGIFFGNFFKNESLLYRFIAPETPYILDFTKIVGAITEVQIIYTNTQELFVQMFRYTTKYI